MTMTMNDNMLDSRALGRTDCYAQRFMRPGRYSYNILPSHAAAFNDDRPFMIVVEGGGKDGEKGQKKSGRKPEMVQHNVIVKGTGARFVPDERKLTIAVGDLVLWNGPGAKSSPFAVVGDQDFFDSARLTNECGYSHAFGAPGEYHWKDAYGSKLSGVIKVVDPQCKCEADVHKWRRQLAEGSVVMIADGKAKPEKVEVAVGQTVFFAVVTTKKPISITDERLLDYAAPVC
ncbi:hypothetical protein K3172_14895 [Qipengyuania sp. 6B39]|uniref:hypothetical protein n=1 Tax=Qipengyuania proteolytica TaxID=2867239 RepID=UPI001C8A8B84|nr:hypothetical protein [Qipengyuania proteolytica]MBX7497144.1 hypothetical protein [Qipengyuania proteolytica]